MGRIVATLSVITHREASVKERQHRPRTLWLHFSIVVLIGTLLVGQNTALPTKAQTPSPTAQTADAWHPAGTMTDPRVFHAATLLLSGPQAGNVLVTGGENWSSPAPAAPFSTHYL